MDPVSLGASVIALATQSIRIATDLQAALHGFQCDLPARQLAPKDQDALKELSDYRIFRFEKADDGHPGRDRPRSWAQARRARIYVSNAGAEVLAPERFSDVDCLLHELSSLKKSLMLAKAIWNLDHDPSPPGLESNAYHLMPRTYLPGASPSPSGTAFMASTWTRTSSANPSQRWLHPDCGEEFKDINAHLLTPQDEWPQKRPIQISERKLQLSRNTSSESFDFVNVAARRQDSQTLSSAVFAANLVNYLACIHAVVSELTKVAQYIDGWSLFDDQARRDSLDAHRSSHGFGHLEGSRRVFTELAMQG